MPLRAPFLLAAFLSSALLFAVEPLAARLVLPTFGGAPAVWNGTLLFFQAALLLGYGLAHLFSTRLAPRTQRFVQPAFLLLALLTVPLARSSALQEWVRDRAAQGGAGVGLLLVALMGLVGLPFVALSVNSPLLQRWYAATDAPDAHRPTFLYAAGNVGSLLALLAYPLLAEPNLTLTGQADAWRWGLGALAALVGLCAFLGRGAKASASIASPADIPDAVPNPSLPTPQSSLSTRLRWIALAAVPSALLMGCTTYLTSNVAPIPLLWVVPLALYLLTFILVYAARPIVPVTILGRLFPMLVVPLAVTMLLQATTPIGPLAALHLGVFFVAAWMCHGLLAREAPRAEGLTEYWLYVSLGGAVGGVLVAVVAPLAFSSLAEYPLALVAAALLRPAIPRTRATRGLTALWDDRRGDLAYPAFVLLVALVLVLAVRPTLPRGTARTFLVLGVPAALAFAAIDRPARFGLALGAAFWIPTAFGAGSDGRVLLTDRSFFGVHRVIQTPAFRYEERLPGRHAGSETVVLGPFHELVHGNTIHGRQDLARPHDALTYYYKNGPIGSLMSEYAPPRVALVGLGVGSLAAYGRPGQALDYFEIDPVVARIARDPRYFTFLRDSQAQVRVILGDARLTLSRAQGGYGLVVLDAFSSDSIPIHLLTVECFRMAFSKLTPHGLLAIHISNRYLDLEPVLAANARALHLAAMVQIDPAIEEEKAEGKTESHWVLLGREDTDLDPYRTSDWSDLDVREGLLPWTDDYSNVLGAFNPNQ